MAAGASGASKTYATAVEAKEQGNTLYRAEKYADAVEAYTQAIALDATDATFYSNRAACYLELSQPEHALADSVKCLQLRPDWAKSYFRRAAALAAMYKFIECRCCCRRGLALDPESKELKQLNNEAHAAIVKHFTNASEIDFKFDTPPNSAYGFVFKGKPAPKDTDLSQVFEKTKRSLVHVAVMMQHPKIVADLVRRGASVITEDVFGLTPLHYAALIGSEGITQALKLPGPDSEQPQPVSSSSHATPRDLARVMLFMAEVTEPIRFLEGSSVRDLSAHEFLVKTGYFITETSLIGEDFMSMMLGALPDESIERTELSMRLTGAVHTSAGHANIILAHVSDAVGLGVFAAKDFAQDEYICMIAGVARGLEFFPGVHTNPNVFKLQPKFDFRVDCSTVRSLGAYVNHSTNPNALSMQVLCRGVPVIALYAARPIPRGEQICMDYDGRLSATTPFMSALSEQYVDLLGGELARIKL